MKKFFIFVLFFYIVHANSFAVEVSVRELVDISSLRKNQVSGYGLVVGLSGSGDSRNFLGKEAMRALLRNRGIEPEINERNFNSKNIAAVFVSASFLPGVSQGDQMDVWVSSIGDAKSIAGGFLLQTPLLGADGNIYAVAQARIPDAPSKRNNISTLKKKNTILLDKAAIIERNVQQTFTSTIENENEEPITVMFLSLRNFDVSNAIVIVKALNEEFPNSTQLSNNGRIIVTIPQENSLDFISAVLEKKVNIRETTKVVIDPSTATIVMGGGVAISKVSVSKAGIKIDIQEQNNIVNNREEVAEKSLVLEEAVTVDDLVSGLNKLGLTTKDIIDILRAIDNAGALHGKLEVM